MPIFRMQSGKFLSNFNILFSSTELLSSVPLHERRHRLKRQGYDLERISERVAEVLEIKLDEVFSKGRQEKKVKARSLLCYWSSRELSISHTSLARRLEMSISNISLSVERGELIAREGKYTLEKQD